MFESWKTQLCAIVALGDDQLAMEGFRQRWIRSGTEMLNQRISLKEASRAASRQAERELILRVLDRTRWNRRRAAEELQISYKALLYIVETSRRVSFIAEIVQGESMRRSLRWLLILSVAVLNSVMWAQSGQATTDGKMAPAEKAVPEPISRTGPDYVIGADDTLHISVWKEPDLSETLPVRADGKISLPLLGDVAAAGFTPTQLATLLTDKLKKYVADPRVTVIVTAMNSQRVYVTGEVTHTGSMTLTPNMTVLQALASAGFTQFANTKGIYVLRVVDGKQVKIPVNYKKLVKGEAMDQNVVLRPGDTIVVP